MIISNGLVAYWHFTSTLDTSGTFPIVPNIAPDAPEVLDGMLDQGVTKTGAGWTGTAGIVKDFPIPTSMQDIDTGFTLETWVSNVSVNREANSGEAFLGYGSSGPVFDHDFFSPYDRMIAFNADDGTNTIYVEYTIPASEDPLEVQAQYAMLSITYDNVTKNVEFFINGVSVYQETITNTPLPFAESITGSHKLSSGIDSSGYNVSSVRLYNRGLSASEVSQNYQVGWQTSGLPDDDTAYVTINSVSAEVIGVKAGHNTCDVEFQFDKAVTEYTVRVGGFDHLTGTEVASGGAIAINTPVTAQITNSALASGQNRINIYGKTSAGKWTPQG